MKGLTVRYGRIVAVENINFEVRRNEIVALLGSNGAGKSSTLKAISGVIPIERGSITFNGEDLKGKSPHEIIEAGIAQVPEGRKIFPYLTVEENLLVGAVTAKAWHRRKENLEKVYNIFPVLKERRTLMASQLSGGEQQMLVIGRGLMACPKLLMLDEPSLGLGPRIVSEVYRVLEKLRREENVTIFLSEQNARMALKLSDRAYIMENGRIVIAGESTNLINNDQVKKAYLGI